MENRKVIITVAPVCHAGKTIPQGSKNPVTPEHIAADVTNCVKAGAAMVHLHVRDIAGEQTFKLDIFSKTLDLISAQSDAIIQGSTGGIADLSLEERCVCLDEPRVEVASLNMGSVNFGDTVYINTAPDIKFWAARMKEKNVKPELEHFDLSMIETTQKMLKEGVLEKPLHYNFCLGSGSASNLAANGRNLGHMVSLLEPGDHWGLNHDSMQNFTMLAGALAMGATTVRVGFEDSFYYAPGKTAATNAQLVEKLAALVRLMGLEPATPAEAREIMHLEPK